MCKIILDIYTWAKADYNEWPLRFILEIIAWATSIGCSITMAVTLPHPPFLILYPLFMMQCMVFGWSAFTRRSFGMVGNYGLLVSIDCAAYANLVMM